MNTKTKLSIVAVLMVILLGLGCTTIPQAKANSQFVLHNGFSPAETTYTNKTMPFEIGDIYGGYSYWTLSGGGVQGFDSIDSYVTDCDAGEYEFFGFDEFVNHSIIYAETNFKPIVGPTPTLDIVALGYFYQKTALNVASHWALAITLDEVGFSLVYNTGNGNSPTNQTLVAYPTPFDAADKFNISIANLGDTTGISIYRTTYPEGSLYNGSVVTGSYDARSLYAGFGDIAYSSVNVWGLWDYLTIRDIIVDTPTNGYGFSTIDAYIDEEFTHTFYDVVSGYNSTLEIDSTVTNITLVIQCWLNGTLFDIDTVSDGVNKLRHNVTVTNSNSTVMFAQSNFTYCWGIDYMEGLFLYQYRVQLDFTVEMGQIYMAIISMEVFY